MPPGLRGRQVGFQSGAPSSHTVLHQPRGRSRDLPFVPFLGDRELACLMRYEAVFFDLYGTLLIYGDMTAAWAAWLQALHRWIGDLGQNMDPHNLARRCDGFFSRPAPTLVAADLTVYEARLQELVGELGIRATPDQLRAGARATIGAWQDFVDLDPEATPVLSQLSETHALALITNFDHPPHVHKILQETGLAQHFPVVVVSGDVGVKKPDPEIFATALSAVDVAPERIAYVGDAPEDILAAQGAGMTPVRLQRDGDTEGDKAADFRHSPVPRQWTNGIEHPTVATLRELPGLIAGS